MLFSRTAAACLTAAGLALVTGCSSSSGGAVASDAPTVEATSAAPSAAATSAAPTSAAPSSAAPAAAGTTFTVDLTGAVEVPGPGDPDGAGQAKVTLDAAAGTVCYTLTVTGVDPLAAGHIHEGAAGAAGPVVVPLFAGAAPTGETCVDADAALVKRIVADPTGFYVNVHNDAYKAGALRAQLR